MATPRRLTWLALGCAVLIVLADQAIKDLLIQSLTPHRSVPLFGDVVRLYLTFNDSAAFSIGYGQTWIFALLSTFASLAIIAFLPRMTTRSWAIMAGIALGGVVGNLVDRLIRHPGFGVGQVVDYIQIPFNFPIFNLADSAIVVVAIVTVIRIMRGNQLGK